MLPEVRSGDINKKYTGNNTYMSNKFLEKIVINAGIGRLSQVPHFKDKVLPEIMNELALIAGQRGAVRRAKISISNFKIREGDAVGIQITLRGKKMNDFFIKLNNIIFPRVKDFRGIDTGCVDKMGNLNVGFRDQYVFPEIDADRSTTSFGFQITIVPIVKNRDKAIDFYRSSNVPLKS
ncbi:50S ribosomal protein L5 [Candidatus Jorgensenbacteria bacterium RIFCSPLOWO2_02_FULL_45_12]|uniref:50S ribosomal protein L5 n=2 Tax=Candidatus Joergenseniibacteriota TaxID=1752739 RepID=A0A1F6BQX3_9BACT|nr:MAG: 50S ribosomal protein L5 [Candidatus Jorgensenbacteria bacterium GW2011_GWA2_45_9]OGG38947.1 MAG: 50S ribosomal protein L5 [Candidatus Jorgensenbacteria bacterium RIFCSPHIGHO2_02_FULL_45_20]OGG42706.1 MAG: 50S ribosomal protein L5 [Candidatus Jorgensenbacteria bacterium RIFCSPLOWO2_02_FULL_45_12]